MSFRILLDLKFLQQGHRIFTAARVFPYPKCVMQKDDRFKTILVIVTGLLTIALIFKIDWLIKVAVGIGLLSVFIPLAAKAIEWIWLKLALMLGWTNSKILLSVIYFGFLMPIALFSRPFTKDPLTLRGRKAGSLFIDRNHPYRKEDLNNIW